MTVVISNSPRALGLIEAAISQTLEDLSDRGAINISVGEGGDILYSANPDFDINKLDEE